MLKFTKGYGFYVIEEPVISPLVGDHSHYVWYTDDLKYKKIDNDPWRKMTVSDMDWFNKYYRHKFED